MGCRARHTQEELSPAPALHVSGGSQGESFMNQRFGERGTSKGPYAQTRRGSALLIVLLLLSVMVTLMVSNAVILRRLKVELQLLEQKQTRATRPTAPSQPETTRRP